MIPGGEAHQGGVAALIAKADPNNLSFRMKNIESMFTNESAQKALTEYMRFQAESTYLVDLEKNKKGIEFDL